MGKWTIDGGRGKTLLCGSKGVGKGREGKVVVECEKPNGVVGVSLVSVYVVMRQGKQSVGHAATGLCHPCLALPSGCAVQVQL
jgi:hypothetical protein